MALRLLDLDNALPIAAARPKKQPKIAISAHKEPDLSVNSENRVSVPPSAADASIDYISSEDLKPFEDPHSKFQVLLGGLESKDWLKVCESFNDVRRFARYHSGFLQPIQPRCALCKTSIMASDVFAAYHENLLEIAPDAFSQLLLQLLLKAAQDKKFVCEEADKALFLPLLHKLSAYARHSNPRIRAKAAISISICVSKMDLKSMEEFGVVALIEMASNLLNDKLPEAREVCVGA